MSRTGILPSFSPSAMIALMLIFVAVVTTLTPTWAANGDCVLAVNVTTANWHDSSTWSGCTGSNGLPGTNESVSLSGEGVVITIQANKAAVAITYLYVGDYARLLNHGDLTVSYEIDIENGGELTSDGSLAIVSTQPIRGSPELYISFGHLAHTGDLVIGASSTTSNETIHATFYAYSAKVEIGGSLSLLSTETGGAYFQGSGSHIKTGGTFRMTGGNSSLQWSGSELDIDIVEGNLALGTWDAATYTNNTGSVSVSMGLGTILLRRGSLLLESGAAKGAGSSGSVQSSLNGVNVAVAGAVIVKSGDVNAQAYGYSAGSAGISMSTGSFAVTAVDGEEGSGSMLIQGGNGGAGSSTDSGGSGGYVNWNAQLVHLSVAKDVTLIGGNGGSSNSSTGGQGGSAYFGSAGNIVNAAIGGNLYISTGDGGFSNFGQGGSTYGAYLEFYNGGSLSVGGDVVLNDGNAGSGVYGGYAYSGYFELAGSSKMTVGGSFKMGGATAGSSTGGGYGGSCESPDRKKRSTSDADADADKKSDNKRGFGSSAGPVYIYESNLAVTGDMTIVLCNAGNGLAGNGGNAWEYTYFSVSEGSTVTIGGSLAWNGGNGGHAVNTTAHSTTSYLYGGYGAYRYLVAGYDVVFTVSGDVVLSAGSGGNVTGASGTSGNAGGVAVEAAVAGTLSIDGDLKMTGAKAGSVSAASIADSTGLPGSACGLIAYAMQEGVINVGGDVHMSGCDAGTVATQVATSAVPLKKKRTLNFDLPIQLDMANTHKRGFFGGSSNGEAGLVAYMSSKFVVGGSVTLIGGIGSDATVNNATYGGTAALGAQGESSVHIEGTTTIISGRGGDSDDAYGGDAGYAAVMGYGISQLRTGDLTIRGARAGQGLNSTLDGKFGPVALTLQQEGQYQQYGQVTITEGSYRDYNVSKPTGSISSSYVGATESSQWTIMPCATGGVSYSSSNSSTFAVTKASTFRDCRGSGATIQSRPTGDISSDVSCLGCTCTGDVLLFDECGSGAMLQSAAHQMLVAVLEAVAGLW